MVNTRNKKGNLVARSYAYSVVCPACLSKGIIEKCTHLRHRLPSWQSERKLDAVSIMMGSHKGDKAREMLGVVTVEDDAVFSPLLIEEMYAQPPIVLDESVSHIFVAIDPNAGQQDVRPNGGSDYAVVSFYETRSRIVIAGIEAIDAHQPSDYLEHIYNHCLSLRKSRATHDAVLVLIIECDTGQEHGHLYDYLLGKPGMTKVVFMKETVLQRGE